MRPAGPKLTLLFNKQVELGRIVHDMLAHTFSPKKTKVATPRRDTWTDVSLNELNSRLVSWHESLPNDMRWKKWFAASSDVLQPNVSALQYVGSFCVARLVFGVTKVESLTMTQCLIPQHKNLFELAVHSPQYWPALYHICRDGRQEGAIGSPGSLRCVCLVS